MTTMPKKTAVLLASLLASWFATQPGASADPAALPVKVSPNKRYFVDQNDKPLFWLGTTQWQLFRGYTLEDAKTILERTAAHGFSFVQVMLLGVGDGAVPNVYGQRAWIDNNPLTPNEAYFQNVDAVVQSAADHNLTISMTLFHQRYRKSITVQNGRAWAKWLAGRYQDAPNIVWSMTPEAKLAFVPILRELAAGLREGDAGRRLVTFKPDPAPYSSSFVHAEEWLDFNSMQTWNRVNLIYPFIMVYLGEKTAFSVNMDKLTTAQVNACWIDPRTGDSTPIGVLDNRGVKPFTTPAGWEDA